MRIEISLLNKLIRNTIEAVELKNNQIIQEILEKSISTKKPRSSLHRQKMYNLLVR